MSMSTGDSRRPFTAKQSGPAASDGPEPEVVDDAAVGGVLPVKKSIRRAGASGSGGTSSTAGQRTRSGTNGGSGAETETTAGNAETEITAGDAEADSDTNTAGRANGSAAKSGTAKATPAKATPAKGAPAKASPAKTSAAKASPAKAGAARTAAGKTSKAAPAQPAKASTSKSSSTRGTVPGSKGAGARPGGRGPSGYGKGRKPIAPVRVAQSRNWGPIALYTATALLALGIIGFGAWKVIERDNQPSWQDRAAGISGVTNYTQTNPEWFEYDPNFGNHQKGVLTYPINPPVGGTHNPSWQNCMGDVYTAQIAKEQAVHSLEHGAVWITYQPDLPQDQIDRLASKVRDVPYMLMSPMPGQDAKISLQAWGYQLKLDQANDGRIDDFISALRENATQEPGARCSGGITDATVQPLDLPGA